MSKSSILKHAVLITALCMGSGAWVNAQTDQPGQPGQSDRTGQTTGQREYGDQEKRTSPQVRETSMTGEQPMKVNKGSSLIGMEVRNQNGEKLGKIRDIVFDLNRDQVAYVVLAVSEGAFGLREKLHAVPLRAFQANPDGEGIILNADKEKLARAEGFDKNHWPSISNPSWGAEPFWQETRGTPGTDTTPGTPGTTPGTSPGTTPEATPGTAPGTSPGSRPGETPSTRPGDTTPSSPGAPASRP